MKRTVKAWAVVWEERKLHPAYIRATERYAIDLAIIHNGTVIPCTITYDDGRKPKRKK